MVNTFLTFLIVTLALVLPGQGQAGLDPLQSEILLGEHALDGYFERGRPDVLMDLYSGKLNFSDEQQLQNYFQNFIFSQEKDFSGFLKTELPGAMSCSNDQLSKHYEDLRYSFRLITLSYLLEGQWHLNMVSRHFALRDGCQFDFDKFLASCRPKHPEMKKFLALLKKYNPKYQESLPKTYIKEDWWKDFAKRDFNFYSHYRLDAKCDGKCGPKDLADSFKNACQEDEALMNLICSEEDQVFGVSANPDAYDLLARSNIINTYNDQGEALGCLRRFSMVNSHREVNYKVFSHLFQTLRAHLQHQYQERFIQGRVFFYGSGKEFEEKGLTNLYVMEQPLKIAELDAEYKNDPVSPATPAPEEKKIESKVEAKVSAKAVKKEVVEIKQAVKSAFLQAAELRKAQNLSAVEVDMQKLRYDYVFSLNMLTNLSSKLKSFMTREALIEMVNYDKLGLKDGPVPLLFIKYMIDMQEHTGLYNLVSIVGDEFYVSNEIDPSFNPALEKIKLINNGTTGGQWQILVIKP